MDFTKDIYINKDKVYENQEIVILYKGYLFSNNLTSDVYLSYGYGKMWDNKNEIKMKPSTFGYLATVKIETGENLQFCFRDNNGNWDNNNSTNYVLPIYEDNSALSFETVTESSKEIPVEYSASTTYTPKKKETENEDILNPSVVSSNSVELYQTVDLNNVTEQAIPDNTIITQLNYDTESVETVKESVIKSEQPKQTSSVEFSRLTDLAKQSSVKAFDDGNVTAGSVYVNSIMKDIQEAPKKVENVDEKSLVKKEETSISKVSSIIKTALTGLKSAFAKVVSIIKTSLQTKNEDN